jgi:hypothetical protein
MTKVLLALIVMLAAGAGVANAATHQQGQQQQGDAYNWMQGGGG